MDGWIALALLILVGFPVAAIVALVVAMGGRARLKTLEREIAALRQQVARLELRPGPLEAPAASTPATPAEPQPEPSAPTQPDPMAPPPADEPSPDAPTVIVAPLVEPAAPPPLPPEAIAAAQSETASAPPPPPSGPTFSTPPRSFEEFVGKQWTVWIGGLALALGGVFLVKYSIDAGFFTPLLRVVFGAIFAGLLIAAGEYLRRRAPDSDASPQSAPIPSILTAAGTIAAFATVYAAYALYHLIGDAAAFVLLGAVAVATMLAALLHGPWVAALGVIGAYATPLLIATATPNFSALVAYLLAVTLAAFGIARVRLWQSIALATLALALVWGLLIVLEANHAGVALAAAAYTIGLLALIAGFFVVGLDEALEPPLDRPINLPALAGLTGIAVLTLLLLQADDYQAASLASAVLSVLVALALGWRYPSTVVGVGVAGVMVVLALAAWRVNLPATLDTGTMVQDIDGLIRIRPNLVDEFAGVAVVAAALFLVAGGLGALRATPQAQRTGGIFAGSAGLTPVLVLIVAWVRIDGWVPSPLFAFLALVLAVLLGTLTTRLIAREAADRPALAVALAAIGTIAALGAALTISLEKGALTIALALMVAGVAYVNAARPIAVLRPVAAVIGLIVLLRVGWNPRIVGDDLGTVPVLNWLLYGYGVPTLAFAYAARSFCRQLGPPAATDVSIGILEALTILFAGLLCVLELHHAMTGGRMLEGVTGVDELGLMATIGILGFWALAWVSARTHSVVQEAATIIVLTLALIVVALGLLIRDNPAFTDYSIGTGLIVNLLLPGYLVPALAAALAAWATRRGPDDFRANSLAVAAVALSFVYVTLMTRHLFQGEQVGIYGAWFAFLPHTSDAEIWTYSAVWLVFGIVALAIGGLARSPFARAIAAAIIVLTVVKAFVYDMSALTGIWRAFSFIALGAVLIAIGFVYQTWLFRRPKAPE